MYHHNLAVTRRTTKRQLPALQKELFLRTFNKIRIETSFCGPCASVGRCALKDSLETGGNHGAYDRAGYIDPGGCKLPRTKSVTNDRTGFIEAPLKGAALSPARAI